MVRAYVALTKPRVIELLLVTTIPAMILAQRGIPSLWLVLATLIGGSMAAGEFDADVGRDAGHAQGVDAERLQAQIERGVDEQ